MKPKLLSIILVLSLGLNLGVVFTVGYHRWKAKGFYAAPCWHKSPFSKKLDLNSEQIKIMEKRRQEMSGKILPIIKRGKNIFPVLGN